MKTLLFCTWISLGGLSLHGYQLDTPSLQSEAQHLKLTQTNKIMVNEAKEIVHLITISGRVDLGTTIIPVSVTVTAPSREQAENEAKKAIKVMKNIFEQI